MNTLVNISSIIIRRYILLLVVIFLIKGNANSQSRSPLPGGLYVSCNYSVNDVNGWQWYSILLSTTDCGRNFSTKYLYAQGNENAPLGGVLADAAPGVLYNILVLDRQLYHSFDDGASWEFVEQMNGETDLFACGNVENEIFWKKQGVIFKSEDNGLNWIQIQDGIIGQIEVGNQPGEIYIKKAYGYNPVDLTISYSADDGVSFISYDVDTIISGYYFSGYGPTISRGAIPGELYLASWWRPANFKIFRSTDYGQSFTLQYEQTDTCFFYDEAYHFTAGRGAGEFFVTKRKIIETEDGLMTRLHIFYSNDYAQSFTEYIHQITHAYNGSPCQVIYSVNANVNPNEGGTIEGTGKYNEGAQVVLKANPNDGYEFINWTENDTIFATEPVLSFSAEKTRTLKANFRLTDDLKPESGLELVFYPNPASTFLKIDGLQAFARSYVYVDIYCIDGQKLISKRMPDNCQTIDISDLPHGIYIIRVSVDGVEYKNGKLIKK